MRGKVILNPKKIENNIRIMAPKMDEERGTQGKKRRKKKKIIKMGPAQAP